LPRHEFEGGGHEKEYSSKAGMFSLWSQSSILIRISKVLQSF